MDVIRVFREGLFEREMSKMKGPHRPGSGRPSRILQENQCPVCDPILITKAHGVLESAAYSRIGAHFQKPRKAGSQQDVPSFNGLIPGFVHAFKPTISLIRWVTSGLRPSPAASWSRYFFSAGVSTSIASREAA